MLVNRNIILSREPMSPSQYLSSIVPPPTNTPTNTHTNTHTNTSTNIYTIPKPVVKVGDVGTNTLSTGRGRDHWVGFVVIKASPTKITVEYDDKDFRIRRGESGTEQWSLRKDNRWVPVGKTPKQNFNYLSFGERKTGYEKGIF